MRIEPRAATIHVRELLLTVLDDPRSLTEATIADLDLLLRIARRVKLLARISLRLDRDGLTQTLPVIVQDQLKGTQAIAASRRRAALWELDRIGHALGNPPFSTLVALKGSAYLLQGLPNADGRVLADVDILVAEDMIEQAERTLGRFGWQAKPVSPYDDHYYRAWTHELPPMSHLERETEVDLHHNILPRTARLKPSSDVLLRDVRKVEGTRYHILAPESLVLHAMTHLMFDSDLSDALRDLVDIDEMLRHFASRDPRFWQHLAERAEELDLRRPAFYALRYSQRYFATPIPDELLVSSRGWGPPGLVLRLMDQLVPLALFPPHPDVPDRRMSLARFLLYLRSHWIRMPPLLLLRHLSYKFYVTQLKRAPRPA